MTLKTEEINKTHNRRNFDCGEHLLNEFLRKVARQSNKSMATRTYVLVEDENGPSEILGYYTLLPSSIEFPDDHPLKKRYAGDTPVYRLARLGVDNAVKGMGLGKFLVIEALQRIVSASPSVGGAGCVVDAKNEDVKRFYEKLGFVPINDSNDGHLALWLPIQNGIDAVELAASGPDWSSV